MKNINPILPGILAIVLCISGCQGETLKSSFFQSRPANILQDQDPAEISENSGNNCSALNPHPLAESISETFDMTYDQVMTLYCDGSAFSDILLALETSQLVEQSAEELLFLLETRTWDEIWQAFGVKP